MKKREFSNKDRVAIVQFLILHKKNEKLQKGAIALAAKQFKCNRMTISRIWKRASENNFQGESYGNVDSLKKQNCGRKCKDYGEQLEKLRDIPHSRRGTLRSAAHAIGVPKSTLFRILKKGKVIKRVSSTIKPLLTEKNKKDRVEFCLSKLHPDRKFMDLKDYIHIDEKWFYLKKCKRSYYMLLDEETPHRTCKSKRFISKVMFMAAVARPRWDPHKKCLFDGKIGIWPFVTRTPAQRNSKNRKKGTLITKPIESVTSTEIRKMLFENILPTIRKKWPKGSRRHPIFIQQDNAKPHLKDDDPQLLEEGFRDGWKIQMKSQPPNSPDFNVLDLGFFLTQYSRCSIKSRPIILMN